MVAGASYITFLRSDSVEDELVRQTATAMRHSSATAAVHGQHPLTQLPPFPSPGLVIRFGSLSTSLPVSDGTQSAAYDKNGTQPLVERAMRATAAFSAKFMA